MNDWRDQPMSPAQDELLATLQDRVKHNYDSTRPFYDVVEKITGKRVTTGLTKGVASDIIDAVKGELL